MINICSRGREKLIPRSKQNPSNRLLHFLPVKHNWKCIGRWRWLGFLTHHYGKYKSIVHIKSIIAERIRSFFWLWHYYIISVFCVFCLTKGASDSGGYFSSKHLRVNCICYFKCKRRPLKAIVKTIKFV